MKRRLLSFLLIAVMIFSAGCTAPAQESAPAPEEKAVTEAPVETTEAPAEEPAEDIRDAKSTKGMVAAAKKEASEVGVQILEQGGNAVDAAVAVGFALGVLEPNASGLGGGGFMTIRDAETGEVTVIDFRETAPMDATDDMYELGEDGKPVDDSYVYGGKSVGVPGETAGLLTALEMYGTMDRETVMKPAIDYAKNGIEVTESLSEIIKTDSYEVMARYDETSRIFLKDGLPPEAGDVIKNLDLANTLQKIADEGKDGFYKGEIPALLAAAAQREGGILKAEDFSNYEVQIRKPVVGNYRGYEIVSVPPASSGGTHIIEALNILENFDMEKIGYNTVDYWHVMSQAMQLSYADRAKYMADTDFVDVPLAGLISKEYAAERAALIDMDAAQSFKEEGDPWLYESGSTTHFSVVDAEGNMVSCTKSINHFFGSGVTAEGTGVILNDHMADFVLKPGTSNSIEPGKRPLSSMSPTIILKDGKSFATLGTPGGKRIITTMILLISDLIDYDMDIQTAIDAPRITNYEGGKMRFESRIPADVQAELAERGHEMEDKGEMTLYFGGAQGIVILEDGTLHGGADPRRDGVAVGVR